MASINTLGIDTLSLRGADQEFHRLSRFFRTRAEAQAAIDNGDWVPVAGVINAVLTADEGILHYDIDTSTLLNAESTNASVIADIQDGFDFTGKISAPVVDNMIPFYYADQAAFPSATDAHGAVAHSHADGALFFAHSGAWHELTIKAEYDTNKTDTDAAIALKADLDNPDFTSDVSVANDLTVGNAQIFSAGLVDAVDDTAAAAAGVEVNQLYRNGSVVMIRVA